MTRFARLTAAASISALALAAAACTPADNNADADRETDTTTIIEREVPADPVVVEREVPVPTPPVVVERDRRDGDSTTIRANENGLEVETTNR
ncbi:hypothetical protein [uncultured Brevundimonas sp.]|uniref:hypothetical protein n=1 Tax=uncultured Brevundimonas sp. TaxID=213418 RepID=UPI002634C992|nr:hypothetical protein [uncultured Brevundimonas sp.]